jgi:hypothetical protein
MDNQPAHHRSARTRKRSLVFILIIDIVMKAVIVLLSVVHLLNLRLMTDSFFTIIFLLLFSWVISIVYDLHGSPATPNEPPAKTRLLMIDHEISVAALIVVSLYLLVHLLAAIF